MVWFPPITFVVGGMVAAGSGIAQLNVYLRNNVDILALHVHNGIPGSGGGTLGPLVSVTFIDAAVPGTPDIGVGTHTRVYTTGTAIGFRSGSVAGSAAKIISNTTHTH